MGKDQDLLDAARNGNFCVVEKILVAKTKRSGPLASLRRGPGANVQDASGYSALHHAALNGHKDIVELLLTNEASTNIVDVKGSSPLHLAAWSGNVDIVRMLLSHGPSIPNVNLLTKDNETALHCAAQYGHTEVVCLLLEYSCDPTFKNTKQETALDLAAQYGRLETVDMLVRTHPELIQPYNGLSSLNHIFPHTPLHLASRNGHKAVVEVLLARGMNVNVRTGAGTALHEAALCGKTEVVRALLENRTDLNIRDSQNNTVVDLLKEFPCHAEIFSLIKRYHRAMYDERDDLLSTSMSCSPFENPNYSMGSASPTSVSPMHYDPCDRRLSSSCSISATSDIQHYRYGCRNPMGLSKSLMETNYLQDDMMFSGSQDFDSVSVCSTASSSCSRDRRSPYNVHMGPTPPKKPPRRNLSISPTHTVPPSLSSDQNGYDTYEYAFVRINNGQDQNDLNDLQEYSNLKRKSRDIETETEEELLLLVFPGTTYDATSNGSLSSSISLSDKSVSTDNNTVEEYVGDVPFAGLFKGSVTPDSEMTPHYTKLERPTSLSHLKNVYTHNNHVANGFSDSSKSDYSAPAPASSNRSSTGTHNSVVTTATNGTDKSTVSSMSILSPFDEQEEWAKISEIMASFGNGVDHKSIVTELEQEFESRLGFTRAEATTINDTSTISFTSVGQWLQSLGFSEFENAFINFGYDDINFINGVINDCDLKEIGVMKENDRQTILKECARLPNIVGDYWTSITAKNGSNNVTDLVKEWLDSINLNVYVDTFRKNLYNDMDRIKRIWEVELTAFLEITKPGHRRRILASVNEGKLQCSPQATSINDLPISANLDDLHADLDQLKSNIQELEEEIRTKNSLPAVNSRGSTTPSHVNFHPPAAHQNNAPVPEAGTLRHRKKSRPAPPPPPSAHDLEIRNPSELLVGVPSTLKAQWRHKPSALVSGTVDYTASYLGSTVVKELRGTESTKKSIQKLKKSTSVVDCRITPEIILAISYRGVKFLNVSDHSLICEHEIRNIHCACQDSEDLTHFAYITKDRASKTHYCHVFCVQTMDQATEVILTLGEAFEVAYQMALKEHTSSNSCNGHTRSHSTSSFTGTLKKNSAHHSNPLGAASAPATTTPTGSSLSKYFVRNKDSRIPIATLLAEAKFHEVKKLLNVEGASDVKMFKQLVLNVGNGDFRAHHRVEKEVADEISTLAISELDFRSQSTTQLRKYYQSSYPSVASKGGASISNPSRRPDSGSGLNQYFIRDKDSRIPLWTMMVEERFDDIKRVLHAAPSISEVETLRLVVSSMADKVFRETHGICREVADEVFECAAEELMVREGSMALLLDQYNKSYN